MKLSELVDYLNQLDKLDYEPSCLTASRKLSSAVHVATSHTVNLPVFSDDIKQKMQDIENSINDFRGSIDSLKRQINIIIRDRENEILQESKRLHDNEMRFDTNEYILHRRMPIDNDSDIKLRAKIRNMGDWRIPGMIIRPGVETFIEDMVPLDPLYLVDSHKDLLEPCIQKFTIEYQRRLRPYVIDDTQPNEIFEQLPKNQFGVIFAYNYFNFKPIGLIKRYLSEFLTLLRPGGSAIFTFNDCDYAHAVALAERSFMCYTPGRMVYKHAVDAGFEVVEHYRGSGDLTWLEIRKPGEITSLRGGQALAKIVHITDE